MLTVPRRRGPRQLDLDARRYLPACWRDMTSVGGAARDVSGHAQQRSLLSMLLGMTHRKSPGLEQLVCRGQSSEIHARSRSLPRFRDACRIDVSGSTGECSAASGKKSPQRALTFSSVGYVVRAVDAVDRPRVRWRSYAPPAMSLSVAFGGMAGDGFVEHLARETAEAVARRFVIMITSPVQRFRVCE